MIPNQYDLPLLAPTITIHHNPAWGEHEAKYQSVIARILEAWSHEADMLWNLKEVDKHSWPCRWWICTSSKSWHTIWIIWIFITYLYLRVIQCHAWRVVWPPRITCKFSSSLSRLNVFYWRIPALSFQFLWKDSHPRGPIPSVTVCVKWIDSW